jgi:hypothetical protein
MDNLVQKRREDARWKILRIADAGRPTGVGEAIVNRILADAAIPFSRDDLRRELTYLHELALLDIHDDAEEWIARLTAAGVAVVEYTAPAPAGVARPRKSSGAA